MRCSGPAYWRVADPWRQAAAVEEDVVPQRLSEIPMADLVPETSEWNTGRGIDLRSWIGCVGNIEYAIA